MAGITIVLAVLAALAVFVIAAVVVGREAHRLDAVAPVRSTSSTRPSSSYRSTCPRSRSARLTPADVAQLLTWHMRWLHAKGLQPTNVIDRRQDITTPVVMEEDTVVGYLPR